MQEAGRAVLATANASSRRSILGTQQSSRDRTDGGWARV